MTRTRQSAAAVGLHVAVLLVMVLCPIMSGAVPAPTSSSCHEDSDPGAPAGALDALTCCTTVTVSGSLQPSDGADAVAAAPFAAVQPRVRPAADRALAERPGPLAPPLFVQYASLLI